MYIKQKPLLHTELKTHRNRSASCTSDNDCTKDKSCNRNRGECINPCSLRAACGVNALCRVVNHNPRCECPECFTGRPHLGCKRDSRCSTNPTIEGRECGTSNDCPSALYCEKGECKSPCGHTSICEGNERCVAANHQATCQCKNKLVINVLGELTCPGRGVGGCRADVECPPNMACISSLCQNPCTQFSCAPGKKCQVLNHLPLCMCDTNCEAEASICLKDPGCPSNMACVNFQCIDPCTKLNCPNGTPCIVVDHKAECKFCPPGFTVDRNYGCLKGTALIIVDEDVKAYLRLTLLTTMKLTYTDIVIRGGNA